MSISKRLRSKAKNTSDPYKKRTFRGVTLENRTISALRWAEKNYLAVAPKKRSPWRLGQGSFSQGTLSAGTHSKGGTLDIMFAGLNAKQRKATVKWLRKAGFAAWARLFAGSTGHGLVDHARTELIDRAVTQAVQNRRANGRGRPQGMACHHGGAQYEHPAHSLHHEFLINWLNGVEADDDSRLLHPILGIRRRYQSSTSARSPSSTCACAHAALISALGLRATSQGARSVGARSSCSP